MADDLEHWAHDPRRSDERNNAYVRIDPATGLALVDNNGVPLGIRFETNPHYVRTSEPPVATTLVDHERSVLADLAAAPAFTPSFPAAAPDGTWPYEHGEIAETHERWVVPWVVHLDVRRVLYWMSAAVAGGLFGHFWH